jgi:hypothetical protein
MASDPLTILCSGMLAGTPHQGGATWAVLQYVLGLRQLGHRVYIVEPIDHPTLQGQHPSLAMAPCAAYFQHITAEFDLEDCAALLRTETHETVGLPYARLRQAAQSADLLINISGMLADEALLEPIPRRVYLDLDPAFNQLWHTQGIDMRFDAHTHFATVGLALGDDECPIPTLGKQWIKTLPPVVLDEWPVATDIAHDALTTVANWRAYGSIEHDGVLYGQKAHSLRQLLTLPGRSRRECILALAIHPGDARDLADLAANGWYILDPVQVAGTPDRYREFVRGSWAELGVAKLGYVLSRCGWFSDRSACYLASGRPVLAQETGFSRSIPSGSGILTFESVDDAQAGIEALESDYGRHARAARELAAAYFESGRVLGQFLDHVSVAA